MKPTSRCQGQGIFIIDKLAQVAPFRHKNNPPIQNTIGKPPLKPKNEEKKSVVHNPPSEDEESE